MMLALGLIFVVVVVVFVCCLSFVGRDSRGLCGGPGGGQAARGGQEEEQRRDGPEAHAREEPRVGLCELPHREPFL